MSLSGVIFVSSTSSRRRSKMPFDKTLFFFLNGHKISSVIFLAYKYKIFEHLKQWITVKELAQVIAVKENVLKVMLDILTSINLLEKKNDQYVISAENMSLLSSNTPDNRLNYIETELKMYTSTNFFNDLEDRLTGKETYPQYYLDNQEVLENYVQMLDKEGIYTSFYIAREFRNRNIRTLLDVGGGVGTYAKTFCKLYTDMCIDVYDLAIMREKFQKNVKNEPCGDRINFHAKNIIENEIDHKYDAILLSNILHVIPCSSLDTIIEKVCNAINPNGMIIINDDILDKSDPKMNESLLRVLDWTVNGSVFYYSLDEISQKFAKYGLSLQKISHDKKLTTRILFFF